MFFTNLQMKINRLIVITEWPTPKNKSYKPSGENKLEMKTPIIIPMAKRGLKATKWLNISEMRNCTSVKPKGATSIVTAIYNAAIMPLTAKNFYFHTLFLLSFFSWDGYEPRYFAQIGILV